MHLEARLLKTPGLKRNKFLRWYVLLMTHRMHNAPEGHIEKHHILPRSLGGSNSSRNLVALTPREHFIAHRLLARCTEGKAKRSMNLALSFFMTSCRNHQRTLTSKQYEAARKAIRLAIPIFEMTDGKYYCHPDFYRFCSSEKIGRSNLQKRLSTSEVVVITCGKHKGRAFSFTDVGSFRMQEEIKKQLTATKALRASAVERQWSVKAKRSARKRSVVLKDSNGQVYKFDSMLAAQEATGIPWTTLQSCRKVPHRFKHGAGAGWLLHSIGKMQTADS